MFKTGTCHVQGPLLKVVFIHGKALTPKKCMVIAKSLTDTKHVVLVPLPAFDKAYRPRGCRGYHGQILVDQLTLSQP